MIQIRLDDIMSVGIYKLFVDMYSYSIIGSSSSTVYGR